MKLRYRLFLWVGLLFVIAFVVSFYVEDRATRRSLNQTRQSLIDSLYEVNEKKRQSIEDYIADILWKIQAQVDAVLQGVARYGLVRKGFVPSESNVQEGTWLDAASLMVTNQWVGFIQNVSHDDLMSEIIVHTDELQDTYHFPLTSDIHTVAMRDHQNPSNWNGPYIGIPLSLNAEQKDREVDESYFVLFTPKSIRDFQLEKKQTHSLDLSINLLEPFLKWMRVPSDTFFLDPFIQRIQTAQSYLKNNPNALPSHQELVERINKRKEGKSDLDLIDYPLLVNPGKESNNQKEVLSYLKHYIEHYNKVGLVWGLSALANTRLFGGSPIGAEAPIGMGMFDLKRLSGKALESDQVFHGQIAYDVEKALGNMKLPTNFLTTHLDIISPKGFHHVFFGNTLKLEEGKRTSYLTLGAHGGPVLSALARATHQMAMFVSQGKIIAVSNPEGDEVSGDSPWYEVPIQPIMDQTSGLINFHGEDYFFLHIAPYKEVDLHFFIFNLKSKEFQFIDSINEGSEKLIDKVSMQMRIASILGLLFTLIFLNNIAKRVTKPIAHLAEVTQTVAEGKLDEIQIPKAPKSRRRDEIYDLYHAFFEMVKGLREKEKVRGVLNKVVSKEIAEETLKGHIQLGGEEKQVTVFFADIRHFTAMTEHMDPKDVIQVINRCMTKVSEKIDLYGGVIDKYVGDEVMALFGAPLEKKEAALSAIKCAVDILEAFEEWNRELEAENKPPIKLGIGIHTGTVVAGNMGAENRLNYTVLGANVNLASRLCSRASEMQILISQNTLEEEGVKQRIDVESLESLELKGFTEPVSVFAVKSYQKEGK